MEDAGAQVDEGKKQEEKKGRDMCGGRNRGRVGRNGRERQECEGVNMEEVDENGGGAGGGSDVKTVAIGEN